MTWKQKIEAQIAELRCFQVIPGKDDYCVWEGRGKCLTCQKADTMQALLDVAVAAENMTYADAVAGAETWGEMKQVLDKLREVGDD